jgi:AraC family transcriptional regulator of adaptative response/methylated-DNA-[protein]-cysteine methyltransferase
MQANRASFTTDAARWSAVRRRSPRADGVFFYAVATTGVYCRPTCPSRPARRENVTFYRSREDAERAGFRPCRRCRPDLAPRPEREAALIADACAFMKNAAERGDDPPSLAALASRAALSPYHFHRLFRRIAGVTPKAYASARRQAKIAGKLQAGASVTEAIYDAGFPSASRFYETSAASLGMKPSVYRRGGEGESIWYVVRKSSLGGSMDSVLVAGTARGVCAILLGDDPATLAADLRARFPKAEICGSEAGASSVNSRWVEDAVKLVDDPRNPARLALPLDIRGTAFQRRVWEALRAIRPGSTCSYTEVAASIGRPRAARAVAGACAANRLAVAIPCHRVVTANGSPGGYRWGAARKRELLDRESALQGRSRAGEKRVRLLTAFPGSPPATRDTAEIPGRASPAAAIR